MPCSRDPRPGYGGQCPDVKDLLTSYSRRMPPRPARRASTEPTPAVRRALSRAVKDIAHAQPQGAPSLHLEVAAAALALAEAADRLARAEIIAARDDDGATWEQVGEALGITRQAAHERFRTGPDGMHSRLYMQKAAQSSARTSADSRSRSGAASAAKKASRTRS